MPDRGLRRGVGDVSRGRCQKGNTGLMPDMEPWSAAGPVVLWGVLYMECWGRYIQYTTTSTGCRIFNTLPQ